MFDSATGETPEAEAPPEAVSLDELQTLLTRVASVDGVGATEAEVIDHLTAMERLKSGLAAAQASVTATLHTARNRAEAARGIPAAKRCHGLAAENGQGLCEACNYAKQAPGWHAEPRPGQRHAVEITTPTGHRYRSRAPTPPVFRVDILSPGEQRFKAILDVA